MFRNFSDPYPPSWSWRFFDFFKMCVFLLKNALKSLKNGPKTPISHHNLPQTTWNVVGNTFLNVWGDFWVFCSIYIPFMTSQGTHNRLFDLLETKSTKSKFDRFSSENDPKIHKIIENDTKTYLKWHFWCFCEKSFFFRIFHFVDFWIFRFFLKSALPPFFLRF